MTIGAFYQCFKQPRAFDHCLQNFRIHYPDVPLWIVNDGGDPNLESISKKYNPIHYELKERLDTNAKCLIFSKKEQILEWLRRLKEFVMTTNVDFILLLEDDVFVQAPTKTSDLKYDINGANLSMSFRCPMLDTILHLRNPSCPEKLFYGGCGGCFLRTSFFKRIFLYFELLEHDLDLYSKYCTDYASDKVISYLTWLYGGTIGMYPGFVETHHTDYKERTLNGTIEIIHQYKALYETNNQGYMFNANGEYYANLLKSFTIPSLRHFDPFRPICIFTSTPEYFNPALYTIICYDVDHYSKQHQHLTNNDSKYFLNGTIPRLLIHDMTPFKETVYLDADIVVMKDIEPFWNFCTSKEFVMCGGSDEKNRAPDSWHWNTIREVIETTRLSIPRINGGMVYWKKQNDFMNTIQPYLTDPGSYNIKPWFRGNYVDEIFIAIYMGIKGYKPDPDQDHSPPNLNSFQTYRTNFRPTGDHFFYHVFQKDCLPAYFQMFKDRNPTFLPLVY